MSTKTFYDVVDGKKVQGGGLLPHEKDKKDFQVGALFGLISTYKPKHDDLSLDTIDTKNQSPFNTCGWNSATVQKQADEKVKLSVRGLVMRAKQLGFVKADGFSSLRNNQRVVQKYGIPEERFLEEDVNSWTSYSRFLLTKEMEDNARSHQSHSFWNADDKDAVLKLLDKGRVLETGCDWYSDYNMRGGFSGPWIIDSLGRRKVGGHAFVVKGYKKNYHGYLALRCQNSFGTSWGESGDFYAPIDFALRHFYTFYAQLDIPVDVGQFVQQYSNQFVKGDGPGIYKIENGLKRPFTDKAIFYLFGGRLGEDRNYQNVPEAELVKVPNGPEMKPEEAPKWDRVKMEWSTLKLLGEPKNLTRIEYLVHS